MRRGLRRVVGIALALVTIVACAADDAKSHAVEVTFQTLGDQEEGQLVTIEGYLDTDSSISEDQNYGRTYYALGRIYPTAAGGPNGGEWGPTVWLAGSGQGEEPAPNEMGYVPGLWESGDIRLRLADGSYRGWDDLSQPLRVTGWYWPGEYGGSITVEIPGPGLVEPAKYLP